MTLLQGKELAAWAQLKVRRARLYKVLAGASEMSGHGLKAGWEGRWGQRGVNKPGSRRWLRSCRTQLG